MYIGYQPVSWKRTFTSTVFSSFSSTQILTP